jgi:autophagy-related protein 2
MTNTLWQAKFLPLRLHVDQDALDFMKKFFSFRDSQADEQVNDSSSDGPYFRKSGNIFPSTMVLYISLEQAEVFPVDIKLDYKPRRVDYRALREGRTIELMNFFHFDGAEMTLRHITLSGVSQSFLLPLAFLI